MLVHQQHHLRLERIFTCFELGDFFVAPQDHGLPIQLERIVLGGGDTARPHTQLFGQHLSGGETGGFAIGIFVLGFRRKAEAFETANKMVLDHNRAVRGDIGSKLVFLAHALHQGAGALIDEPLRQTLVHGIR